MSCPIQYSSNRLRFNSDLRQCDFSILRNKILRNDWSNAVKGDRYGEYIPSTGFSTQGHEVEERKQVIFFQENFPSPSAYKEAVARLKSASPVFDR
jgi:hypothetical protein